jgi:hypothetical protein
MSDLIQPEHKMSESEFIYIDPNGADWVLMLRAGDRRPARWRPISIHIYRKDVSVNIAKGLFLPHLRGTWLPCFDIQRTVGLAVNWLGVRVRVSLFG